jgi:hypothetical protein
MAILRAGPFANSTDSFLDEPAAAPSNIDGATLPVNCANYSGSSDWSWKYLKISTAGSASEFFDAAKDQTTISENFINGEFFEEKGWHFITKHQRILRFLGVMRSMLEINKARLLLLKY